MSKNGFRLVFESDKFLLTKSGMYVRKGYMSDGLFKLNVMTIVSKLNEMIVSSSSYLLASSHLWHGRLGHVNYNSLRRLINLECLPKFDINLNHKCEICVEAKMTRKSFSTIERSTEPLALVHSDLCDFKSIQSRGGKKYIIIFLDDYSRFCYLYLLRSKDETLDAFILYKNEVEN